MNVFYTPSTNPFTHPDFLAVFCGISRVLVPRGGVRQLRHYNSLARILHSFRLKQNQRLGTRPYTPSQPLLGGRHG